MERVCTNKNHSYKHNLYSLRNRLEKRLSLTLDPMGRMFQNASSLKPLGQLKPNCPGMIIGRSSVLMPIGNPRWLPPQVIVLTQDYMGKIQKYILL